MRPHIIIYILPVPQFLKSSLKNGDVIRISDPTLTVASGGVRLGGPFARPLARPIPQEGHPRPAARGGVGLLEEVAEAGRRVGDPARLLARTIRALDQLQCPRLPTSTASTMECPLIPWRTWVSSGMAPSSGEIAGVNWTPTLLPQLEGGSYPPLRLTWS